MASLFPSALQVGQLPDSDEFELNIDQPIKATQGQRFRDRDEHIMSALLDGAGAAFDLIVNNITVIGTLTVSGQFEFGERAMIYANLDSGIGTTGVGN